ncbi:TRAP transporter substrate-binding protein [Paraglaciecola sp. L3A3]|uniref:TRAP transporter substrate-binding protein n=1 Tax=Paraglaciecola sp. L3A3 TaxID=2686358 RepID=UPI001E3B197D|nr:TRAP transporter substrate-binding protein [Paraglaciecola sp. L3A3]
MAIILLLLISGCADKSNKTVLRVGHTLDTKHSVHKALEFMSERLKFYSNGEMSLKLYPNGTLGSERELVELLQIGSLAMTKVSAATLESFVDDMRLFGLPYVFSSRDHRWQILESDIGEDILHSMQSAHLYGLGYFDAGSRSFYSCDKMIRTPDDVKGLKIRVMNSQNAVKMIDAFNGSATPISWGELYAALQQGVVDGAENNPPSFYSARHYEVCKNYSLNEHTSIPDVIVISQYIFQHLSEPEKKWLKLAMSDAVDEQKRLWLESENFALDEMKKVGLNIYYPDKKPFMQAVSHLHNAYQGTVVGQYLERIKAKQ